MFGAIAYPFSRPITARTFWRMDLMIALFIALLVLLLLALSAPAARAANTIFLTDRNGQVQFPLSPPNRATGGPGAIDNMAIGATTPAPGSFSQIIPAGGLPTIASGACGTTTNGAVVAGSTSQSMKITIGAAATTTCTIAWPALSVAPKSCTFAGMNAAAAAVTVLPFIAAPTTTGVVFSGAVLQSTNWAIHCF